MATRIILVDDAPIMRQALAELLADDAAFDVVGVAGDADAATRLAQMHRPDLAIVDVRMPGGGPATTEAIQLVSPHTQVLAYSAYEERQEVLEMVRAGAGRLPVQGHPATAAAGCDHRRDHGEPRFSPPTATAVIEELGTRLRTAQTWADWETARRQRIRQVLDDPLDDLFAPAADRIVLEVTEHAAIGDYPSLATRLAALRGQGVRVAIDDVGAGFASLRHIISIRPDVIKLDASLTWGVPGDRAQRTLARGLGHFAAEMAATVVAEGIETDEQLKVMADLGVDYGQGYLLARREIPAGTSSDAPASKAPCGGPRRRRRRRCSAVQRRPSRQGSAERPERCMARSD